MMTEECRMEKQICAARNEDVFWRTLEIKRPAYQPDNWCSRS
jgi:hypothetical protein